RRVEGFDRRDEFRRDLDGLVGDRDCLDAGGGRTAAWTAGLILSTAARCERRADEQAQQSGRGERIRHDLVSETPARQEKPHETTKATPRRGPVETDRNGVKRRPPRRISATGSTPCRTRAFP